MFYVQWRHGTENYDEAKALRYRVFVEEQGYSPEIEVDNWDIMAWHCLIMVEGKTVATGRVFTDGEVFTIGRLCVDPDYRGQGFGDAAFRLLLERALQGGAKELHLSAQSYIIPLYEKFGFVAVGEEYFEEDVPRPHRAMVAKAEDIVFPRDCESCAMADSCDATKQED
ncbi:GNAT family N-acetyltransferase [Eubacteriales bacterium OttesenSCG-928-N14]|nr:GNAT family N-acetyltransferase [Eubacteriales bacterium OttesenSCG-928-N14]